MQELHYDRENDVEIIINDVEINEETETVFNPKSFTAMCKNIMTTGDCKRDKCTFAHNAEQLRPLKCKYDRRCVNERCTFIHNGEMKEDFCKRLMAMIPEPKIPKKKQIKSIIIKTTPERAHEDLEIALKTGNKYFTFVIEN